MDELEFDSVDDVRKSFIRLEADDLGVISARNINDEEAKAFFRSYETGVQHVSDILESKGLW